MGHAWRVLSEGFGSFCYVLGIMGVSLVVVAGWVWVTVGLLTGWGWGRR